MAVPFAALSFPEIYERDLVGPLFKPWAGPLLDDVQLAEGDRLLDVACGTGIVARVAKARLRATGVVVGVDSSGPMLAVARRVAPDIDWREGDAAALPLGEGERFQVVTCQQGLQFFPDRAMAIQQMHSSLVTGGRVAVSAWRPDDEMPLLRALRDAAERRLGPIVDRRHSFGGADALCALLESAGFTNVTSRIVSQDIRFTDGAVFVRLNATALTGMSGASREMSEAERQEMVDTISRESVDLARPYTDQAGLIFELRANVATGRKA